MHPRLDFAQADPGGITALLALERHLRDTTLEPALLELVRVRCSQINGCAYCIDMHTQDARAAAESEQRLYAVSAWADTPFFSERERAALAWAEVVTRIADVGVPESAYAAARAHFEPPELTALTLAVVSINGWNRLCVAFRCVPGDYRPAGAAD